MVLNKIMVLEEKYSQLKNRIGEFSKVAVAFSGGIDSTFLLHSCLEVLGTGSVLAISANSTVQAKAAGAERNRIIDENFQDNLTAINLDVHPLNWPDFVANSKLRCFYCKKRLYQLFLDTISSFGDYVLFDGTNFDDLHTDRPGLEAVRQLGVVTPLADSQLTKDEIRQLARKAGLTNADLPANSCLATRIPVGIPIELESLLKIEKLEAVMAACKFSGMRVKLHENFLLIVVRKEDLGRITQPEILKRIHSSFKKIDSRPIYLDLAGR